MRLCKDLRCGIKSGRKDLGTSRPTHAGRTCVWQATPVHTQPRHTYMCLCAPHRAPTSSHIANTFEPTNAPQRHPHAESTCVSVHTHVDAGARWSHAHLHTQHTCTYNTSHLCKPVHTRAHTHAHAHARMYDAPNEEVLSSWEGDEVMLNFLCIVLFFNFPKKMFWYFKNTNY